ncbi:5-guanidino-2-oxopentanoate decarboxylase [Roseovarius sp.]|uniref:5-guanidino-2-oxopentanoate decarboxylase n=1 Tax=Roseovarius sp. TaxID=1486281 RepID=UPI003B599ACE
MTQRPLGAQISHMLKARGVDVIFGIPGVHNVEMYRGIEEAGIRHVLARHEQGAGFMADGYARASGKPGVAYVITGPGLTNVMTPMGQAYSDSVPMLVISSCLDETAARRGQLHQMIDQEGAARCICDWSFEVKSAGATYGLIERAFNEFSTARPRTKHLQVPIALGGSLADAAPAPVETRAKRPIARPEDVAAVADALGRAKTPMILFGGGSVGAGAAARAVVERSGAATMTTYAGRGVVGADLALDFGAYLARPDSADVLARADLVLVVGSELSEIDLWRDELGHKGRMIRVDIDPVELEHPRAELCILSDAGAFLAALADSLPERAEPKWNAAEVTATKARWRSEVEAERPGIVPVVDALRDACPADTMIYSDMTQFAYAAKEVWPMDRPGHWHHPFGYGTLGYGMPAAIGGAIAREGKPTLAICGDSGFQYTLQELGTAVEHGLPLPIILWDNGKLKEIEDAMIRSQIAPNAVVARNPDFCALAQAYGAHAVQPGSLEDMGRAVRGAFDADRPTLIHVKAGIGG